MQACPPVSVTHAYKMQVRKDETPLIVPALVDFAEASWLGGLSAGVNSYTNRRSGLRQV